MKIPKELWIVIGPKGVRLVRNSRNHAIRMLRQAKFEEGLPKSSNAFTVVKYVPFAEGEK
jgi:hypothetical protein